MTARDDELRPDRDQVRIVQVVVVEQDAQVDLVAPGDVGQRLVRLDRVLDALDRQDAQVDARHHRVWILDAVARQNGVDVDAKGVGDAVQRVAGLDLVGTGARDRGAVPNGARRAGRRGLLIRAATAAGVAATARGVRVAAAARAGGGARVSRGGAATVGEGIQRRVDAGNHELDAGQDDARVGADVVCLDQVVDVDAVGLGDPVQRLSVFQRVQGAVDRRDHQVLADHKHVRVVDRVGCQDRLRADAELGRDHAQVLAVLDGVMLRLGRLRRGGRRRLGGGDRRHLVDRWRHVAQTAACQGRVGRGRIGGIGGRHRGWRRRDVGNRGAGGTRLGGDHDQRGQPDRGDDAVNQVAGRVRHQKLERTPEPARAPQPVLSRPPQRHPASGEKTRASYRPTTRSSSNVFACSHRDGALYAGCPRGTTPSQKEVEGRR